MLNRLPRRLGLLLILSLLINTLAGGGYVSATTGDYGIITISNSKNMDIQEDVPDYLGLVVVAMEAADAQAGKLKVSMTLPEGVLFDPLDRLYQDDTAFTLSAPVQAGTAFSFRSAEVPAVIVDSSAAARDIAVDIAITYIDANDLLLDTFEGFMVLARWNSADIETVVSAASPLSVFTGNDQKLARITFTEDLAGCLEAGSQIILELPEGFKWSHTTRPYIIQGTHGLRSEAETDGQEMRLTIIEPSTGLADKLRLTGYITVYPDAPPGNVLVSVYDATPAAAGAHSHVDSTDLIVAVMTSETVTVTAADSGKSADYIYRATQGSTQASKYLDSFRGTNTILWPVTFHTSSSYTRGDDLLLTLPEGIEFMAESMNRADFRRFRNHGIYDHNRSLWLTVDEETSFDLKLSGLEVGVTTIATPDDLVLTLSGDLINTQVVVGRIADRARVTASSPQVKVGLNQPAGVVTMVETEDKAFADGQDIRLQLSDGARFSSLPSAYVNQDQVEVTKNADDALFINLDKLRIATEDTITIKDLNLDIDQRCPPRSDIRLKIGGGKWFHDDLNQLDGQPGAQFASWADEPVYEVTIAVTGSAQSGQAVFRVGQFSYIKDGATKLMGVAPFVDRGRLFVPVRFIANALNIPSQNIYWDGTAQTITLVTGQQVVQFKLGSTTRLVNGIPVTMDMTPLVRNNRIFLPARLVTEALGGRATWDAADPNQVILTIE